VRPEPVAAPIQQPAPEPEPPVAPEPVAPEPVAATLVDDGVEEEAPAAPQTETPEQVVEWREPEMVAEPVEIAATQPEPPPATRDYQPPAPPAEPIVPPAPEPESVTESVPEAEPPVEVRPAPPTQRYDAPPPPAPQVPPPTPEPEFVPELAQALRSEPPPAPPSPPPIARHSARPEPIFDPPRREPRFEPRPTPAATPAPTRAPTFETASPPLSAYDSAPHQPAYVEPDAAAHQPTTWRDLARRAARAAVLIFVGWFLAVILLIVAYRFINPPFSMLMAQRFLTGTPVDNEWVPIERISPNLSRAVIVAEDGRFCSHWGVDFVEAMNAIKRASDGYPRGASTITMQMTKNLFLVPAKSYIRKVVEIPLTFVIEALWPKKRILEVYLNIVEWGPGIFGAEAASRAHFGRPASALTSRQAAQLAAVLPNPIIRDAGSPGPRTANKASVIQARAARTREASACIDGRR
jgi:monofunctional biosynthetic peptidoglycan transglycosylase